MRGPLQRYVYSKSLLLKKRADLRGSALALPDTLISRGSSVVFGLRDDFVTPLNALLAESLTCQPWRSASIFFLRLRFVSLGRVVGFPCDWVVAGGRTSCETGCSVTCHPRSLPGPEEVTENATFQARLAVRLRSPQAQA
jgi:hypothetical protein